MKDHEKKTNAIRKLEELGIAYELISFEADEEDLSAENAAAAMGLPLDVVYKTLVLRGDRSGVIEACIPAGKQVDFKALSVASGNKNTQMVPSADLRTLTGYVRGGCSPIAGKKDYPVYIDESAAGHERIAVNAGSRGLIFMVNPQDLLQVTNGKLARIAR